MLDASTVFFRESGGGKAAVKPLALPSRAHAEIVFTLAQHGLHGSVSLPEKESAAQALKTKLTERLAAIAETANRLAASRTSDERKISDLPVCCNTGWFTANQSAKDKQKHRFSLR